MEEKELNRKFYSDTKGRFFASSLKRMTDILVSMHEIVMGLNDERGYFENWIYLVPDGATREDFEDIAQDQEMLDGVVDLFVEIIKTFCKDTNDDEDEED